MKNGNTPPFIKKGAFIVAHYKIVNVYETKELADVAYQKQMVLAKTRDSIKAIEQIKVDDKIIAEFLDKNKIKTVKAPQGTYVEIITPGAGDVVDTSKILKVNYSGRVIGADKAFDSNTDSAFGHVELLTVNMGAIPGTPGSVIKGWTDGLSLLKKGGKAKFYIPSALAYGSRGAGGQIQPNANLLFDIEVVDVMSAAQAKKEEAMKNAPSAASAKK